MPRQPRRALPLAVAGLFAVAPTLTQADEIVTPPNSSLFDPDHAPIIILRVGVHRRPLIVPRHDQGSGVTLGSKAIEAGNTTDFKSVVTHFVAGAASAPSGEFHVRGSHGQYTYYLDGAPLPESVSGSFSDLIDPKNIETLRIYTGGFPARYGGNLAAVFDVTAKAGRPGPPTGSVQQIAQGYATYQTTVQAGGGSDRFGYFLSGVRASTDRKLDPVTQDPLHDAGNDSVVFGKFNAVLRRQDTLVLDTAHTDGRFEIPNDHDRQALGQDDVQRENGTFLNLILRHRTGADETRYAFYSHTSRLRYDGSLGDLAGATPDAPLASAQEDRTATYYGFRFDSAFHAGSRHRIGFGFDLDTLVGKEDFTLSSADGVSPVSVITDSHDISGGDRSAYVEDEWTPGRWKVNYGVRYDIHKAATETSQLSPRVNLTYTAGPRDTVHAYYNRLFQPAPIEDVRRLDPNAIPFVPERDTFYEVGWQHQNGGVTGAVSAYYKTEQDVIDESVIGGTLIREPFNVQKGYVRGIEFSLDGAFSKTVSFYANYARSWAQAAGDFTGGFVGQGSPPGYFYDDHDQTHTANVGFSYDNAGTTVNLDGEYGSGFPWGSDDAGNVNIFRVEPHFIVNFSAGTRLGRSFRCDLTVDNLLNHPYIIKQASPFSDREWGQGRTYGVKATLTF